MTAIKRTLITLVEDRPGVLNRVSSLIRRRGFNIESIAVGKSETPGLSRMVIVVDGATTTVDQVCKQLDKIVRVVKIIDISDDNIVSRELALIKVKSTPETQSEIIHVATAVFRANILDLNPSSIIIQISGDESKVNSIIDLMRGFGILEIVRTGHIAMKRDNIGPLRIKSEGTSKGEKTTKPTAKK